MALRKIQLIIRDSGLASRRKAEEMIRGGNVTLNGAVVEDPATMADVDKDYIKVGGKLLRLLDEPKSYYLFNKPRYIVSTLNDPQGRPCLGDLLKPLKKKLFTVGRLDFDAEGLMILTNDGGLAQSLSHPSFKEPRVYMVKVGGNPEKQTLSRIRKGMNIGDGDRIGEISWRVVKKQKSSTWIQMILYEGKKNEIKRIFSRIKHPVRKLRRIGFGPFSLGKLPVGQWRNLTDTEMKKLETLKKRSMSGPAGTSK
jgi:23S rRNA pseudouridine2605 synthase